jgi:hypothetical protein
MFVIEIGIGLYTYNHSNLLISKFKSSMFMISILKYVNHAYNKIDIDVIIPTSYYQTWKKVQNPRMHIASNL